MGKRVLITGTSGYLGTSFKQYIDKQNENMPQENPWHVTFVSVRNDDWKQKDLSEYDVILHAAGIVHQKEKPDMEELYFDVNYKLTVELAKKVKRDLKRRKEKTQEAKKVQFVFLSTMSVYGTVSGRIHADTKPAPTNFYGKSKLKAEKALQKMETEDFIVTIVRPPMIYGRNCTGNYRLLEKLARKVPVFPKTKNERSMLYIENLNEFFRLVMEKEAAGIYCPQNAEFVNTSEMVVLIQKSYGKKGIIISGFGWILRILSRKIGLFTKVFGTLTYDKKMSVYKELGNYQIVDFGESIHGSKQ